MITRFEELDWQDTRMGELTLRRRADPETGEQLEVQTSDRKVRERYAEAAAAQRGRIAAALRHGGAAHLQLRTDRDWISDVVRFVIAQRQFVSGAVGAGVR